MVRIEVEKQKLVDFSFMPSLKCNLSCQHCMYEASPENSLVLDLEKTKRFISNIDFSKVNAMGFYGGEISCDYGNYQKFIDLIPKGVVKFTITNGTWSNNSKNCKKFLDFVRKNKLQVFISTTRFHKPYINMDVLEEVSQKYFFKLKGEDHVIPMGRARKCDWLCSRKCLSYNHPMRLTLNPYGNIMFCNCDGIYPVIGNYNDRFDTVVKKGLNVKKFCKKIKKIT